MNLPNKLTMLRVFLVPVYAMLLLTDLFPGSDHLAAGIYVLAMATDFIDGAIARKYNMITNFGKFMDPLADKLLVCTAAVCFVKLNRIACWIVLVLIAREFIISGFRLIASDRGVVIAAGNCGKVKTTVQNFMTVALTLHPAYTWWNILEQLLIWAALALTMISLAEYLYRNRRVLTEGTGF